MLLHCQMKIQQTSSFFDLNINYKILFRLNKNQFFFVVFPRIYLRYMIYKQDESRVSNCIDKLWEKYDHETTEIFTVY